MHKHSQPLIRLEMTFSEVEEQIKKNFAYSCTYIHTCIHTHTHTHSQCDIIEKYIVATGNF